MSKIFLLLAILGFSLFACKSTNQKSISPPRANISNKQADAEAKGDFDASVKAVQHETTDFNTEFKNFKDATDEYMQSSDYRDPKTEEDKAFNAIVDGAAMLTAEETKKLMAEGKFSQALDRIDQNLAEIEKKAQQLVNGKDKDNESSQDNSSTKTTAQHGTGAFLVTMGALGFLGAGVVAAGSYYNYAKNSSKADMKKVSNVFAGVAISALYPLIVGSLIVSDDNPSEEKIKAMQASLGIGSALTGIVAIGMGVLALPDSAKSKIPVLKNFKDELKFKEPGRGAWGRGSLLFAGISASLAVWTSQLNLAQDLTPKQMVASKIARAFVVFQRLEAEARG